MVARLWGMNGAMRFAYCALRAGYAPRVRRRGRQPHPRGAGRGVL